MLWPYFLVFFFFSTEGLNGASHIKPAIYNLPFAEASFVFTQGSWQECWPPQSKALPVLANQYSVESAAHYEAIDYLWKVTSPVCVIFQSLPFTTPPPPHPRLSRGQNTGMEMRFPFRIWIVSHQMSKQSLERRWFPHSQIFVYTRFVLLISGIFLMIASCGTWSVCCIWLRQIALVTVNLGLLWLKKKPPIFYTAVADLSDLLHRREEPWFHIPCYSQANGQGGSWRNKNMVQALICWRALLRVYPCTVHSQFLFPNTRGEASEVCVRQYLPVTLKSVWEKS